MKSLLKLFISVIVLLSACVVICACDKTDKCAAGHTWNLSSTTATCLDGGTETYTCKVCKTTKTENVSAYGHDLVQSSYTAPTCKTNGESVDTCSRCGFENKQTILIIDHNYQIKSSIPSTCTTHGSKTFECSMCHNAYNEQQPLLEHDYKLVAETPSTCTTQGSKVFKCKDCTESYTEDLKLLDHKYQLKNTNPSTCSIKGSKDYECSVCHGTHSEPLPLEEHNYELVNTTQSTCIKHGAENYECSMCHDTYSNELPFTDHKYEPAEDLATCFTHGATKEECTMCEDAKNIQPTPLLAHEFSEDGYCEHCGIYKTLFDENAIDATYKGVVISGNLTTKFNEANKSIYDTYWKDHTVTLTITMYDKDGEELEKHSFNSTTIPHEGSNFGKMTIQYVDVGGRLGNSYANAFIVFVDEGNIFSVDSRTNCKSFKIEISCEGYETIEKTYTI